jgi:hypothetical protein
MQATTESAIYYRNQRLYWRRSKRGNCYVHYETAAFLYIITVFQNRRNDCYSISVYNARTRDAPDYSATTYVTEAEARKVVEQTVLAAIELEHGGPTYSN